MSPNKPISRRDTGFPNRMAGTNNRHPDAKVLTVPWEPEDPDTIFRKRLLSRGGTTALRPITSCLPSPPTTAFSSLPDTTAATSSTLTTPNRSPSLGVSPPGSLAPMPPSHPSPVPLPSPLSQFLDPIALQDPGPSLQRILLRKREATPSEVQAVPVPWRVLTVQPALLPGSLHLREVDGVPGPPVSGNGTKKGRLGGMPASGDTS